MNFALITPSYAPDFERCRLLCQSVERFVAPPARHYLLIDRRDGPLFQSLASDRVQLLFKESMLPWWIGRVPFNRRWWWSLRSLPLRGWIVQQLMKIGVANYIDADAYLFVDSDVCFIRPFDPQSLVRDGRLLLFRAPTAGNDAGQHRWHRTAARLLGLTEQDYFGASYIGSINTWRRDHLLAMYQQIEQTTHQNWLLALAQQLHLSEYILYGIFVEFILRDQHLHYFDAPDICHVSWDYPIHTMADVEQFFATIRPHHVAFMLASNLGYDVSQYASLIPSGATP